MFVAVTVARTRSPTNPRLSGLQSAIFNFQALLIVILLTICTCAYLRASPLQSIIDRNKTGYAVARQDAPGLAALSACSRYRAVPALILLLQEPTPHAMCLLPSDSQLRVLIDRCL